MPAPRGSRHAVPLRPRDRPAACVRGRQAIRRACLLDQFRHDLALRQQVDQRRVLHGDQPPHDRRGQRIDPIGHDHRHPGHRQFQRRCAGLGQRGGRGGECVVLVLRFGHQHRLARPVARARAYRLRHRFGHRHDRHDIRQTLQCGAEDRQQPRHLGAPAAWHQRHHARRRIDAVSRANRAASP